MKRSKYGGVGEWNPRAAAAEAETVGRRGSSMIDTATGEIVLASRSDSIGPGLSRRDFLQSRLGRSARAGTINEPWATYHIEIPPGELGPAAFFADLQFHGDQLRGVFVGIDGAEFGQWDPAGERARKTAHEAWLEKEGVATGRYSWGEISSVLDDKSGGSYVAFVYQGLPPQDARPDEEL